MNTPTAPKTARTVPAIWEREISSWCASMRAAHLSPQTISLRRYHLERLARELSTRRSPWTLDSQDLLEWAGSKYWSRETARSVLASLRKFWSWGVDAKRTPRNISVSLPRIAPDVPRPRPARAETVVSAMAKGDDRLTLLLRLANELGMRRGEVAQVHPENDLIKEPSGWSLVVHGKGARDRVIPLPNEIAEALRSAGPGYLFPGRTDGHLSAHWVGTLVSRALADGTTMHQLRHLCATEVHAQTHDLRLVQTLLGHASVATTQRYVAVDDTKMREALQARSRRWSRE